MLIGEGTSTRPLDALVTAAEVLALAAVLLRTHICMLPTSTHLREFTFELITGSGHDLSSRGTVRRFAKVG